MERQIFKDGKTRQCMTRDLELWEKRGWKLTPDQPMTMVEPTLVVDEPKAQPETK